MDRVRVAVARVRRRRRNALRKRPSKHTAPQINRRLLKAVYVFMFCNIPFSMAGLCDDESWRILRKQKNSLFSLIVFEYRNHVFYRCRVLLL